MGCRLESCLSYLTLYSLFLRYEFTTCISAFGRFVVIIFLIRPVCQTELNAFLTSKNTVVCSLFRNPVVMLSMMHSSCGVECLLLYANCVSGMTFCVCIIRKNQTAIAQTQATQ